MIARNSVPAGANGGAQPGSEQGTDGPSKAARQAALDYLARGWAPIDVPYGTKNPNRPGWQNERLTEDEIRARFNGRLKNVSVLLGEPSNGLVDVDLDGPEVIALALAFLPSTGMIFGRPGSPASHWLYRAESIPRSRDYADPTPQAGQRAMLCELRSTGRATIFPPSWIAEHQEQVRWEQEGEPAEVDGAALTTAVNQLAAASLLVRHWPRTEGIRHKIANALAGGLLRSGWQPEKAQAFIEIVASTAGDEQAKDRGKDAVYTARSQANGKRTTGWPTLADLIGEAVVERIRCWLGSPDPEPSTTVVHAPSWPEPLADEAFHGLVGEIVRAIEPTTEADPAALLFSLLAVVGSIVGTGPHWSVSGTPHPCKLFPVFVGATSKGRKGTSWGSLRPVLQDADPDWLANNVIVGLSTGEGLIWQVRDPITKNEPIKEGGRVVDYEEVIVDIGVKDKRMLFLETEFTKVIKLMGREGNTLSDVIRQAWDDDHLRSATKNSPAKATGAHITIIGHTTQEELLRYLDSTEAANGFANRFAWVCVRRSKLLPDGGELDAAACQRLGNRLAEALANAPDGRLIRDGAANAIWRELYGDLSDGGMGLVGAILSRAEAYVMRLATIFAVLDQSPVIQEPHLLAALACWDYVEASARYIFGDALGDPAADAILQALRRTGGMSRTEIRDLFQRHQSAARIDRALTTLLLAGKIVREKRDSEGGRPTEFWRPC